jgi:hypothetical protein
MDTDKKIPLGQQLKERLLKDFDEAKAKALLTSAILSMTEKGLDYIVVEGEGVVGVVNFIENFIKEEELIASKVGNNFAGYSNSFYISLTGRLPIITAGTPKADIYVKADGTVVS